MDDHRIGSALRALRIRRGWTQEDLAAKAGTSRWSVRRIENGQIGLIQLDRLRAVANSLGARLDSNVRWEGGELDRLVNGRHSAMHELTAQRFRALPGWQAVPEVTFAIYGDRGVIDVLGWHEASATVLVVELKTEIVDVQELLGTLDRKRRLARTIAGERGWGARHVGAWLIVAEGRTNRRRVEAHATVLAGALPDSGRRVTGWLSDPTVPPIAALTFLSDVRGSRGRSSLATPKRVGRRRPCSADPTFRDRRANGAPLANARAPHRD